MRNRGFTLMEVLVATAVLTALLVGLMNLYIYCFNLQDEARDINNVTQLMRAELEKLKAMQFGSDSSLAGDGTIIGNYMKQSYEQPMNTLNTNIKLIGKIRVEVQYAKASDTVTNILTLLDVKVIAGWRKRQNGQIIGDGKIVGGQYQFNSPNPGAYSPFEMETAINQ